MIRRILKIRFLLVVWLAGSISGFADGLPAEPAAKPQPPSITDADLAPVAEALEAEAVTDDDAQELTIDAQPPLRGDSGTKPAAAIQTGVKSNAWHIGIGAVWRAIKSRDWRAGSYSQNYPIHAQAADKVWRYDEGGSLNEVSDRRYHDGYVRQDEWTDLDGDTWNWGYDHADQVQDDNTLRLTWTSRRVVDHRRKISISEGVTDDSGDGEFGVYLKAQRTIYATPRWDCRLHLDFMRTTASAGGEAANFRDEQTWRIWEEYSADTFSLEGTGITPASPPYHGNRSDVGPAINNIPLRRQGAGSSTLEEHSYVAYNRIKHDLDLQLLTFSFGMALNYNYKRLSLSGATGPTINLADTDAVYHETLYVSQDGATPTVLQEWRKTRQDSDTTFGYFVQAGVSLQLTSRLDWDVFGRYDWLENVCRDVGESRYEINPEGGSLGSAISFNF